MDLKGRLRPTAAGKYFFNVCLTQCDMFCVCCVKNYPADLILTQSLTELFTEFHRVHISSVLNFCVTLCDMPGVLCIKI